MKITKITRSNEDIERSRQKCYIDGTYYNLPINLFKKIVELNSSDNTTYIKSPIKDLVKALKKDKEYYIAWQANIAMAFKDEHHRQYGRTSQKKIHEIANQAANNFLNLLIKK